MERDGGAGEIEWLPVVDEAHVEGHGLAAQQLQPLGADFGGLDLAHQAGGGGGDLRGEDDGRSHGVAAAARVKGMGKIGHQTNSLTATANSGPEAPTLAMMEGWNT